MSDNPTGSDQANLTDSQLLQERIASALTEPVDEPESSEVEEVEDTPESDTEIEIEEPEEEGEEEEAEPEPEETSFESLEEIAEALGITPDEFLEKYKIKAKVDGEEFEASLNELKNGYQRDSDYRKKTMELAELRKTETQAIESQKTEIQNRLSQAETLIDNLQSQLLSEFQGINWESLRTESPGEYAALLQDFQSRQTQLNQAQETAKQESEKLQKEQQEKQMEQYNELVSQERELLLDVIPDWKDPDKQKVEAKVLADFLKDRGFDQNEIDMAIDHRIIKMAYDLMKSDKIKTKADTVKNKVKNLPKLVKPGSKQTQLTARQERAKQLKAKMKKSGGKANDVAELLMERFN